MNLPKWSGSSSPARAVLRASASDTAGAAAAAGGVAGAGVVLTEVLVTRELLAVLSVVVAGPCLGLVCPPNQEPAPLGAECCLARSGCPAPAISPFSWPAPAPAPLVMVGAMVRVWAGDSLPQLSTTLFSPAMVRVHYAVSNTNY